MLSILIPIYNYDVREFVSQLYNQSMQENIKFEIILADDASENKYRKKNSELTELEQVTYIQLEKNIGRSKIRNFLAEKANYKNLLFADCDMLIKNKNFIKSYIKIHNSDSVICGGICYQKQEPKNKQLLFRWYYGIKREEKSAKKRSLNPYSSFMSGNFFISENIFRQIQFDENISKYGHEDTLFGIELQRRNITIIHINNPLIHKGLEDNQTFINKTKTGIKNLIYISKNYNYSELHKNIQLLQTAHKLQFFKPLILFLFYLSEKIILNILKSNHPKLFLFDFYKLAYFYKKSV
ncbi:MAG: glycosyltransferase [Bacteroidales bacterium]|nr:glycosyltransferase [Bacteroidales bacterium]